MKIDQALPLLGGITAQQFMQTYWQKKPLLIRQAIPGFSPLLDRPSLFALAAQDSVESRLIVQETTASLPTGQSKAKRRAAPATAWRLAHGPLRRKDLPSLKQPNWTLLVQGVDLHHPAVHQLMQQFRFVPDARLDDVMISYATPGGGVGPHFDSYDVFLLQAQGERLWRIGRQKNLRLRDDLPLKILEDFQPEHEYLLQPGDMLYLPPRYAHDGIAVGECMTYSIGFKVPEAKRLAVDLMQLLVDELIEEAEEVEAQGGASGHQEALPKTLYQDPAQAAVSAPAEIPQQLQDFAHQAVEKALAKTQELARLLGETMTEPKPQTWFAASEVPEQLQAIALARGTRMMYDRHHIYINGESYRAAGRDATLMRKLANTRSLPAADLSRASPDAVTLLHDWCEAGWVIANPAT